MVRSQTQRLARIGFAIRVGLGAQHGPGSWYYRAKCPQPHASRLSDTHGYISPTTTAPHFPRDLVMKATDARRLDGRSHEGSRNIRPPPLLIPKGKNIRMRAMAVFREAKFGSIYFTLRSLISRCPPVLPWHSRFGHWRMDLDDGKHSPMIAGNINLRMMPPV